MIILFVFGRVLRCGDPENRKILNSLENLV